MVSNSNDKRKYEQDILNCLYNYSFGLTITDIAEKIDTTRNTVYRYLGKLEGAKLVFKRKVGRYVLYFSKDKSMEFLKNLRPTYKGLIKNLKKEFLDKEATFKNIGKGLVETMTLPINIEGYEELESLKSLSHKELFELIKNLLPFLNLFDNDINVRISKINKNNNSAIFQITNSNMLESEDFLYHFYTLTGFLQEKLSGILEKTVKCSILNYEIFKQVKDSYINLSIEIGE